MITEQRGRSRRFVLLWTAMSIIGGVLVALLLVTIFPRTSYFGKSPRPVHISLSNSGIYHGADYLSGQTAFLQWSAVRGATFYRLQIAAPQVAGDDFNVFQHPLRTVVLRSTQYSLMVLGAQEYEWRVQAEVHGTWTLFTPARHFTVAAPVIGQPVLTMVPTGHDRGARTVQLCWSSVRGAGGYQLQIQGQVRFRTHETCARVWFDPGSYVWSVAALVRGVHIYVGAYATPSLIDILPRSEIALRIANRAGSGQRATKSASTHVTVSRAHAPTAEHVARTSHRRQVAGTRPGKTSLRTASGHTGAAVPEPAGHYAHGSRQPRPGSTPSPRRPGKHSVNPVPAPVATPGSGRPAAVPAFRPGSPRFVIRPGAPAGSGASQQTAAHQSGPSPATPVPHPNPTVTPRPTATPKPTPTPMPTATQIPTATPRPTATPLPTATPVPKATQPGNSGHHKHKKK